MQLRQRLIAEVVLLLSVSCGGGVNDLPSISHPSARSTDRDYAVLVQETFESETVFVVAIPSGAKTSRQALLAIARELHRTRGERTKTTIAFQTPSKSGAPRRLLEQHYADAFAMGIIDDVKGIEEVRFGIFN